jgi:hypothetical protein
MMDKKYYVIIGSPIEYDYVTADLVVDGKYIARIQIEAGKDKMVIEFFENAANQRVDLNDFIAAISEAKELLLK